PRVLGYDRANPASRDLVALLAAAVLLSTPGNDSGERREVPAETVANHVNHAILTAEQQQTGVQPFGQVGHVLGDFGGGVFPRILGPLLIPAMRPPAA